MTREEYIAEFNRHAANWKNPEWEANQRRLEKEYVENFVGQGEPGLDFLKKLERSIDAQKWISAWSSAHQYTLMKDFIEVDEVTFYDLTDAIGKYGFLRYYYNEVVQYFQIGDFFYWNALVPGSYGLINRARIDHPPREAYHSGFSGKWATLGKTFLPGRPYVKKVKQNELF